uniref:AIG1-type G domain-containing protein n=1 Tax=Hucho hucho TaxID=62062 RepID=A0A4W5NXZ4_9TELE
MFYGPKRGETDADAKMATRNVTSDSEDFLQLSEMRIVLLGCRISVKSSGGNTILGREEFDLAETARCVKRQGEVAGRQITVVDTPGWWRNLNVKETPELVKQKILFLCRPGPHALLIVMQVRFSFTEKHRRSVEEHLELLSESLETHYSAVHLWGLCGRHNH